MTEPSAETRIDQLREELATLRRTLYLALGVAGALGITAVAACAGRSAPATKISLSEAGHSVEIDASGITLSEGEHTVRIKAGTLTASDGVIVVTSDGKIRTAIEPAAVSLYGADSSTAALAVRDQLGATLQLHAGADSLVQIQALPTFASMRAESQKRRVGGEASADHATWRAQSIGGASAELWARTDVACTEVERGNPNPGPADAAQMCAPPQK